MFFLIIDKNKPDQDIYKSIFKQYLCFRRLVPE